MFTTTYPSTCNSSKPDCYSTKNIVTSTRYSPDTVTPDEQRKVVKICIDLCKESKNKIELYHKYNFLYALNIPNFSVEIMYKNELRTRTNRTFPWYSHETFPYKTQSFFDDAPHIDLIITNFLSAMKSFTPVRTTHKIYIPTCAKRKLLHIQLHFSGGIVTFDKSIITSVKKKNLRQLRRAC